eukprot:9927967-Alexandrium_andersonii.AAC.1
MQLAKGTALGLGSKAAVEARRLALPPRANGARRWRRTPRARRGRCTGDDIGDELAAPRLSAVERETLCHALRSLPKPREQLGDPEEVGEPTGANEAEA